MNQTLLFKLRKVAGGINPAKVLQTGMNAMKPAARTVKMAVPPRSPVAVPPRPAPPVAAPRPTTPAPAPASVPAPAPNPVAPSTPARTGGWKRPAAVAGGVGAGALALGPTGLGAEIGWQTGLAKDPSRDFGHYFQRADTQRRDFMTKEVEPVQRQYEQAVQRGDYQAIPQLSQQLDKLHHRMSTNDFGTAAADLAKAQEAQRILQGGGGTKHGFGRALLGGYSSQAGAEQYDRDNLKRHNLPLPYHLGVTDPQLAALNYPSQHRANWQAGAWDPRALTSQYSSGDPGIETPEPETQRHNRLFRAAGLGQ